MRTVRTFFVLLTYFGCAVLRQNEAASDNERRVRGQQHTSQTVVAKVVGSNGFSEQFLQMLRNDSDTPFVVDNTTLVDDPNGTTSALVTENVKTTVTRITIPLSTSFVDSNWYRETLRKFLQKNRVALKNSTIEKEYDENGPDVELIILKLWTAATLRDNIITVFGTLLYSSEKHLPADMHSSLVLMYDNIRLRRISVIGFLDVLEDMSFAKPHEQFQILLQKLEKYTPKYLRSCVTYWLEMLHGNVVNIDEFLTSEEGVLIADFLGGIDNWALLPVKQQVLFPEKTVLGSLPRNEELFGKMLSYTVSGITNESITLTRELFGGILLHLPLNRLIPQVDEYQRLFVDLMKKNKISEKTFIEAVAELNLKELTDPFELSKDVFKSMLSVSEEHHELYENILVNLQPITNTYALQDYDVMAPIMNSQNLDMKTLLSSIVPEEYPSDMVDAKDRLLYYIEKSYIDLEFVLSGFVKHQLTTPTELLVAALTRIEVRSTDLSLELLLTVSSLKTHIIYKKMLNNLRSHLSMLDVSMLLLSFHSPSNPHHLIQVASELKAFLHSEFIHVEYRLDKQSTAHCTRPRQCVVSVLKYLLVKNQIRNPACEAKVKEFLSLVDQYGEPLTGARRSSSRNNDCSHKGFIPKKSSSRTGDTAMSPNKPTHEKRNLTREIYPGKYNPSPYKNYNFRMNLYKKPIFISRLNSGKILITGRGHEIFYASERPELTDIKFDRLSIPHPGWINNDFDIEKLLPILSDDETVDMSPIETLLRKENLIKYLNIDPMDYQTKGLLLKEVLKRSLENGSLFESEHQKNFTENYLRLLEYTYTVLPPPPPMTSKHHEVNLVTLLRAIPVPVGESSIRKFNILKTFLTNEDLTWLTNEIDLSSYPSKGLLLKHILQLILKSNAVEDEAIRESVRYFEDKVMTSGYGAQPIDWIVVMENRRHELP